MCMGAQQPSGGGQTNTAAAAVTGAAGGASMGAMLGPWGAAAGAVAGAAAGTIGSIQANKAAKKTEESRRIAQDQAIAENRRRATNDYLHSIRLEQDQAEQETASVSEKSQDLTRVRDSSVGTAVASAAERGVGGRTVEQIVSDYHMQSDMEIGRLNINQTARNQQHSEAISGYDQSYYSRSTGMQPYAKNAVAPVDYFSPAFKLVGDLGKIGMASGVGKTGGTLPVSTDAAAPAAAATPTTDYTTGYAINSD